MNELKQTTSNRPFDKQAKNHDINEIKKMFSDIGVVIEVSEKKALNNFSDSKRVRIKSGKIF